MNVVKVAAMVAAIASLAAAEQAAAAGWGLVNDPQVLEKSAQMPAYTDEQASQQPTDPKVVGQVWASVCTFQNDQAVSQAAALSQLKARAYLKGANGITHLRYVINTNMRSACWHRGYTATGTAVVFG
jgi:invasion protein IalB